MKVIVKHLRAFFEIFFAISGCILLTVALTGMSKFYKKIFKY